MLRLLSTLFALVLLMALAAAAMIVTVPDPNPRVTASPPPTAAERRWADGLLSRGLTRGLNQGDSRSIELSARQLDVLAHLLVPRLARELGAADRAGDALARVQLGDGRADIAMALPMGWKRGGWLNLELGLVEKDGAPRLDRFQVGGLPIPPALARRMAGRALGAAIDADLLQQVRLTPTQAQIIYGWRRDALSAAGRAMLDTDDRRRLLGAQVRLADTLAELPHRGAIDLAGLLAALIASAPRGEDAEPVADNRAAILALAAYLSGEPLPAGGAAPSPARLRLHGRRDLAQHFIASAAIASQGGSALSDLVGLAKELRDSDGGSGFSFVDLTADRAGVRFAEIATADADMARLVQTLARAGLTETDLMPAIDGLPEGLSRGEFRRRFGSRDSASYRDMTRHIESRIDALSLHRAAAASAHANASR
jgi:hypothetical protein